MYGELGLRKCLTLPNSEVPSEVAYLIEETSHLICARPVPVFEHAEILLFDYERFWQTRICSRQSCLELELITFKRWVLFSMVMERDL